MIFGHPNWLPAAILKKKHLQKKLENGTDCRCFIDQFIDVIINSQDKMYKYKY